MLDVNDITQRLKRIYLSISLSYDNKPNNYIVVYQDQNGSEIGWGLASEIDEERLANYHIIIHNIASIKDHLKKKFNGVENLINNCQALQLVIDLDNIDKHGIPLKRIPRSGTTPKIVNPILSIQVNKGNSWEYNEEMKFIECNGDIRMIRKFTYINIEGKVVFDADIVDEFGNKIISFQDLINKSIYEWESFIKSQS